MKMKHTLLTIITFFFLYSACDAGVTGVVVDQETAKPIEGAVVLVKWTETKGLPGLTHTVTYKIFEALTDKDGKITIPHVLNPMVNPPVVTVYKKGYVAWNSKTIFPGFRERSDFKLSEGYVFKLEPFKPEYTHYAHMQFIKSSPVSPLDVTEKNLLRKAVGWEQLKADQESRSKTQLKITGKVVDAETGEAIGGAVILVKGIWSDKPLELISDKDGKVTIEGEFHMIPRPPSVTIYKKGYVAWNSIWIFPLIPRTDRNDFKWQDGYIFRFEKWPTEPKWDYYNHENHVDFIRAGTFNSVMRESKLLKEAIEWEEKKALEERDARNKGGKPK